MRVYLSKQEAAILKLLSVMFVNSRNLPILVHARLSVAANQQGALLLSPRSQTAAASPLWNDEEHSVTQSSCILLYPEMCSQQHILQVAGCKYVKQTQRTKRPTFMKSNQTAKSLGRRGTCCVLILKSIVVNGENEVGILLQGLFSLWGDRWQTGARSRPVVYCVVGLEDFWSSAWCWSDCTNK